MNVAMNYTTLPETYPEFELATDYIRWLSAGIATLGLVGNSLAYMTAANLKIQTSGTGFMKCLAVADSAMVFAVNLQSVTFDLMIGNPLVSDDFVCKVGRFISASAVHLANFTLTALSVDRLWAVWSPIAYKQKTKPMTALKVFLPLMVLAMIASCPLLILMRQQNGVCFGAEYSDEGFEGLTPQLYVQLSAPVLTGVPFLLIVLFNFLIVYKLKGNKEKMSKSEIDATISLILVSFSFFLLNMASFVAVIGGKRLIEAGKLDFMMNQMLISLGESFQTLDHSMNFIFYMVGSITFRNTFWIMTGYPVSTSTNQKNDKVVKSGKTDTRNSGSLSKTG